MFWLDADEYKLTPRSQLMKRRALTLYRRYLGKQARYRMPVAASTIEAVDAAVGAGDIGPLLFKKPQDKIN
jgi:hypothetical protein